MLLETGVNDALTTETDDRYFVYGNYIDEVLVMNDGTDDHYYGHDHLYSAVVLFDDTGAPEERYEYDAYGKCTVLDADLTADADGLSDFGNPYMFTGRRLDTLDGGSYKIMYYRARYYDTHTGRFIQRDPLGIMPGGSENNPFYPLDQYTDGMNRYEYVRSNPIVNIDPTGLDTPGCSIPGGDFGNHCWRRCCAKHDECYDKNGCTSSSWCGRKKKACIKCNDDVSWCFLTNIICDWSDTDKDYYCGQCHTYYGKKDIGKHKGHKT